MREVCWLRKGGAFVGATVLALIPSVTSWPADAPAAVKGAPPEACALLNDPAKVALMDGLLLRLAIQCNRTDLLGRVRQEPNMDLGGEVGSDVRVNDPTGDTSGSSLQSETSLAVNETTGTICSGYNDFGHYSVGNSIAGFSRSTDGGATFVDRGGLTSGSYGDPSIVWRKSDGYFYYATLGDSCLRAYRSTDDCQTFTQVGSLGGCSSDDKEIMAVDNNSTSPYYGRLYVGWTDFGAGQVIKATYSTNGGSTWSTGVTLGSQSGSQGAWPAVAPDGTVYVSWASGLFTGTMAIQVSRSTNGGGTWTAMTSPATGKVEPRDATATGNCGRPALKGNIRYLPSPQIVVGPDGALHVVYSYDPDGYSTGDVVNVYYRKSTDGGSTWGTEVLLNDDGTTRDQFFPALSVGASNVVSATWYDRRLDPNNTLLDYYQRFSFDGGTTWQPSVRVSDVSSPIYLDPGAATCYHGDYDTQVQNPTTNLIQWADDRATQFGHNDPDVYFDTQPVSTNFLVGASPAAQNVCAPANGVFTVNVQQFMGFIEPVTLVATGVPAGGTPAFSVNPVTPPGTSVLTISGTGGVAVGSYPITVTGTSSPSSFVHDTGVTLNVYNQLAGGVSLTAPADGAANQLTLPVFSWSAGTQAATYDLQVATDPGFTTVVLDQSGIAATTFTPTTDLASNTMFYWHVRGNNVCGASVWSSPFSFATMALPGDCGLGTVPQVEFTEGFESGVGSWTHTGTGDSWALWGTQVHGGAFAFHANDTGSVTDQRLVSPAVTLPAGASGLTLQFWNRQYIEANGVGSCYDGGIVEASTDAGATWTQLLGAVMQTDPYDGPVSTCCSNPIMNLDAWCGAPQDWLRSVVDITAYAGQTVSFRFRLGTDVSVGYEGWSIDDVKVQSCVVANQADLAVTNSDGATTVIPGQPVTYSVVASNLGPSPASGATVTDTFPAALIGVSWTCAGTGGGTCTAGGAGNINDTVDLPVSSSVTYTVSATVDPSASGSISTTATVAVPAGLSDPTSGNNSATDTDTVMLAADLSSGMTDHACFALPGTSTTYTLRAANSGPNSAVGAAVTGHFPASLTGVSWTCTGSGGGTCGDPSGVGDISQDVTLPAGGTVTYTATATVPTGTTGWLVATSAVTVPSGVVDATLANNAGFDLDATELPVFCSDLESGGTTDWTSTVP